MAFKTRVIAATKHLALSLVIAALTALLIFNVWYPAPYGKLAGGFALFGILMTVDIIMGPCLTFAVFNTAKPKWEIRRDIFIIVLLQLAALGYGVHSLLAARPIYLAYEGNRFRLVTMADIDPKSLDKALPFQKIGYTGPQLIGTRIADANDPELRESIMQSLEGFHPSYRPERWVPYDSLRSSLLSNLFDLKKLIHKHPTSADKIRNALSRHRLTETTAGYLPLDVEKGTPVNWSVIVDRKNGQPVEFLPLDGW